MMALRALPNPDDTRVMLLAWLDGWTASRVSLYDEEGVEGWRWDAPTGYDEYYEMGDWDDWPTIPDDVRQRLSGA